MLGIFFGNHSGWKVDGDPNFHLQHLWDDVVDVKRDVIEESLPEGGL